MKVCCFIGIWPMLVLCNRATSFAQMEKLSNIEDTLIERIESMLRREQGKLSSIKDQLGAMRSELVKKNKTGESYLAHPVNQFKLIRRFTEEWKDIHHSFTEKTNYSEISNDITSISENVIETNSDLIAQDALLRLQQTYFIGSDEFQSGRIEQLNWKGETVPVLSARDCYDIGRRGYLQGAPTRLVRDWMQTAYRLVDPVNDEELYIVILDHLGFTSSKLGNSNVALKYYTELTTLRPDEERYIKNVNHYKSQLRANWRVRGDLGNDGVVFDPLSTAANDNPSPREETSSYETICRKDTKYTAADQSQLTCFYWHNNEPFLMLGPVKAEMLWHSPEVTRFYDIITPAEVEIIDRLGKSMSQLATVQDPTTGKLVNAHYRISESAWLTGQTNSSEDETIKNFRRRISLITGLTMERAEDVQYSNYGIGGQYEPHFDHATEDDAGQFDEVDGNRIATWLTYLNEPISGGGTAFLTPVFWYNLLRDGTSDNRTRHAACPVLAGEKTVSNIWFHERGEEFTRKCLVTNTNLSTLKMFP